MSKKTHSFEGVITNIKRRYEKSDSLILREELAKYMSNRPCPACDGARLNTAARHVYINDITLPDIVVMPIDEARRYFSKLQISGRQGQIAEKILKEVINRLEFLVNVGLDYLTLDRSAETLSGGEAQRIRLASQIGAGLVGVMYVLDEPVYRFTSARQSAFIGDVAAFTRYGQHRDCCRA